MNILKEYQLSGQNAYCGILIHSFPIGKPLGKSGVFQTEGCQVNRMSQMYGLHLKSDLLKTVLGWALLISGPCPCQIPRGSHTVLTTTCLGEKNFECLLPHSSPVGKCTWMNSERHNMLRTSTMHLRTHSPVHLDFLKAKYNQLMSYNQLIRTTVK